MTTAQGNFPLTGVAALPNVTVAFPGEHWSHQKATETITPGEAVIPTSSGGAAYVQRAASGDSGSKRLGIALRTVQVPDINTGPTSQGPNEIMDTAIAAHEYVHVYLSGAFHLTLITPDTTYAPGDLIGWNPSGARPTGVSGTGSWRKVATEAGAHFEVMDWKPVGSAGDGILTVRSLGAQF